MFMLTIRLGPPYPALRASRGRHQRQRLHLQELRRDVALRDDHGRRQGHLRARHRRGAQGGRPQRPAGHRGVDVVLTR